MGKLAKEALRLFREGKLKSSIPDELVQEAAIRAVNKVNDNNAKKSRIVEHEDYARKEGESIIEWLNRQPPGSKVEISLKK